MKTIVFAVNLGIALLLALSYISVYISPAKAWVFAFIGFAYPYILLVNVLFVVFWMVLRKWYFLISLCMILIGLGPLNKLIQMNGKKAKTGTSLQSYKVMSYNVRLFNYYQWEKDTGAGQKMLDFILEENPSVVCLQEFLTLKKGSITFAKIKQQLNTLPYTHVYYTHRVADRTNFGMATFSKYPIVNKGFIEFDHSLNGIIFSDVVIHGDTLRVFNCHLQSIRLRQDYNSVLNNLMDDYDDKQLDEFRYVSARLREAYIKRAYQAEQLSAHINNSPYPVVVCGDFNDTPFSYSYHTICRNLKDAFVMSGSGIGSTYRENFPRIRIDYILHSPTLHSFNFTSRKIKWSDHYPVSCQFDPGPNPDLANRRHHP